MDFMMMVIYNVNNVLVVNVKLVLIIFNVIHVLEMDYINLKY